MGRGKCCTSGGGGRLVWIDEWNQVGIALKKMLAL